MDWKNFISEINEERDVALPYIQKYVRDVDAFIEKQAKKARAERKRLITPEDVAKNREGYRKKFVEMLGFPMGSNLPLGTDVKQDFVRKVGEYEYYRVQIETFEGLYAYGLYAKHADGQKHPLIIAQHGATGTAEHVHGWYSNSGNYRHMGRRVMAKGAHVLSLQTLLWRQESYEGKADYERRLCDSRLRMLGGSITALEIEMISRCITHFCEKEEVDQDRIGMIGLSYGGMFTILTTAYDVRIKAAVSSCWLNDRYVHAFSDWSYKGSMYAFEDAEIAALIAPRALYVEVGKNDPTFPVEGALEQAERLSEFYKAAGAQEKFVFDAFDGVHELSYNDEPIAFLYKNLK